MTEFEITGDSINGGNSPAHNNSFLKQVNALEEHARNIGKSVGMSSVESAAVTLGDVGYGFRFATLSTESYEAKGIELKGVSQASEVVEKLA